MATAALARTKIGELLLRVTKSTNPNTLKNGIDKLIQLVTEQLDKGFVIIATEPKTSNGHDESFAGGMIKYKTIKIKQNGNRHELTVKLMVQLDHGRTIKALDTVNSRSIFITNPEHLRTKVFVS